MEQVKITGDTNLYRVGPGVLTTLSERERNPFEYYKSCYVRDLITIGEFEQIIATYVVLKKESTHDCGNGSEYYSDSV